MIYAVIDTNVLVSAKLTKSHKNLKNPSADVFALRAFVLTSWLCACEQAPAPAQTSSLVALQLNTSSEEKPRSACAPLKNNCASWKCFLGLKSRGFSTHDG